MSNANQLGEDRQPSIVQALKANVEANFKSAIDRKETMVAAELTEGPPLQPPHKWEIFAYGPYQYENGVFNPSVNPGRIIFTGEEAFIAIVVWMNSSMCKTITEHNDKIMLEIWTSDIQRMRPAGPNLSHTCCIKTEKGVCSYVVVWKFEPTDPACLYETNICARICNCNDETLPDYAGFVRQVYDYDPETLWPSPPVTPGWGFDRPIRFMVADPDAVCDCTDEC